MLGLVHIHQPDVRLMHQRRGLQGLARFLLGHLGGGQFPQFLVDERQSCSAACGSPCSIRDRIRVTSPVVRAGAVRSGSSPARS